LLRWFLLCRDFVHKSRVLHNYFRVEIKRLSLCRFYVHNGGMKTPKPAPAEDPAQPNVYRLNYLAIKEILDATNPEDAHHRQWLAERLAVETHQIAQNWLATYGRGSTDRRRKARPVSASKAAAAPEGRKP
jgi:hypothetical protein